MHACGGRSGEGEEHRCALRRESALAHPDLKELLFPFKIMSPRRAEKLPLGTDHLLAVTAATAANTHIRGNLWWQVLENPDNGRPRSRQAVPLPWIDWNELADTSVHELLLQWVSPLIGQCPVPAVDYFKPYASISKIASRSWGLEIPGTCPLVADRTIKGAYFLWILKGVLSRGLDLIEAGKNRIQSTMTPPWSCLRKFPFTGRYQR